MRAKESKVVVGVEGHGRSDAAVRTAYRVARALGASVELVHASEASHSTWSALDPSALEQARQRTIDALCAQVADLAVARADVEAALRVEHGPPARVLVEAAQGASFLILGAHHREGVLDFGNVVRAALRHATCPVWVVPQGSERELRGRALHAAIDLTPASRAVLACARDLSRALASPVEIVHVFVHPELGFILGDPIPFPPSVAEGARASANEEFERIAREIDWSGPLPKRSFVEGDPAGELRARQEAGGLVIVASRRHSALYDAVIGSTTRRVLAGGGELIAVPEPR